MKQSFIVLATWGSLGDVHPMMAVALELQNRGHRVTLATSLIYREKIESAGIEFSPLRPDLQLNNKTFETLQRAMNSRNGTRFVFDTLLMPYLRDNYEDLTEITRDCDLLVTHATVLSGPLVAEKTNLRWISTVLAPLSMMSVHDPSILPGVAGLQKMYRAGKAVTRFLFNVIEKKTRSWVAGVDEFRQELGLPRGKHPMFRGQFSPRGTLALFSSALGAPQPDWPPNTHQSGFAFYDKRGEILLPQNMQITNRVLDTEEEKGEISPRLAQFLAECDAAGEAPIVFTLGSVAVFNGGKFFRESARAAQILGCRALLIGAMPENFDNDSRIAAFDYAPYSLVFNRASAIVHQGGVGTTAQAMRAGKPMLVVPHSHDQPDNGARMARRGAGRVLNLSNYQAQRVAEELRILIDEKNQYASRAAKIGEQVRMENGAISAADFLEETLRSPR